ncbi:carboxylesterase family protein [Anaerocolumna xylanovorans]|uniref:Carboxylic ester hydrolase n=1 Tax=Anaerocolumna xylanovorans DSM 12503 TaxID=1121345 RepID=A0A1M7Y0Y2_9FIRM|nr:carboxylesterase family protein [Anaerocolumna xylanovorans]SHO45284.1 para-nitrobenzyl esterase [Anaerocolumna xylanovorans DSM 12503]
MKKSNFSKTLCVVICILIALLQVTDIQAAPKEKLNKTTATLEVGKTVTLKVLNTKKSISWSSKNEKIATVSGKGKVKGIKAGTTTVSAKFGKKTLSCKITVKKSNEQSSNNTSSNSEQTEGVVKTTAGLVQGTDNDGIYTYLGVPYAEATERFVPAGKVKPWNGIRMANTYGPMSPQGAILGMPVNNDETGTDNNCQNLNIWTPGTGDGQKRPVMVWLHGGGFSTGTANNTMNDGKNLSQSGDVVVVSVNHRLNVFGHLDLSAYGEKYKYSGNVGLTDIVAALKWIQDNIEAFGGDPGNVTVFGQSGGGAKVLSLMTSPYAKGLFQKGIVESGATETMGVTFSTKEESKTLTGHILENLGITADNIEKLQKVSTSDLQAASTKALQDTANTYKIPAAFTDDYAMEWGPVIDGDYMPTNPVTKDGFADAGKDIPLLIGSNLNEWTTFVPTSAHTNMTEEERNAFAQAYPNEDASGAENVDTFIRLPMLKIMSHKTDQGGAPVYAYVFTWQGAMGGSSHGAEIPFVFDNVSGDADTLKLAKTVSQAWINFARNGIPGADGLPDWKPYTREQGATMLLDTQSELVYNHDAELMHLLEPDYIY